MPSGLCALKLAKAITLPLPKESRHTNSQALTHIRTREGGGEELKPGHAFIWHNSAQKRRCPGPRLARTLDQQPPKIPQNSISPTPSRPGARESGQRTPRQTQAPREGCSGLPCGSSRGGAARNTARHHRGRPPMLGLNCCYPSVLEVLHWERKEFSPT